jgi:hypothetical protein
MDRTIDEGYGMAGRTSQLVPGECRTRFATNLPRTYCKAESNRGASGAMKSLKFLFLSIVLLFPLSLLAQFTTVTAQVKDPGNLVYQSCHYNIDFVNNTGIPQLPLLSGAPFQTTFGEASCDSTGHLSIRLADSGQITPPGTQWHFSICTADRSQCFGYTSPACPAVGCITGTTIDISAALQAVAAALNQAVPTNAAQTFTFVQALPGATTWTVNHNFGVPDVVVTVYDQNGNLVVPDSVQAINSNTTTITFLQAQAGRAYIINAAHYTPTAANPNFLVANPTGSQAILGDFSFFVGGSLSAKRTDGVRQIDTANSQGWSGTDLGAWVNAACADIGTNCTGKIHIAKGVYTYSTPINGDFSIGADIGGDGGLSGGANAATVLLYTGTGTPVSTRGSASFHMHDLMLLWNNAAFVGPVVNNGHLGTGCGGNGCDSAYLEVDHIYFGKSGSGAIAPIIIDTNKSINTHIHDDSFNNYTTAIRGTDGTINGYSNGVIIDGVNQFLDSASGTAILNPGQGWTVGGAEIMEMNGVGSKVFDVSNSAINITSGLDISGLWVGDGATATSQTLMNFCGTGINIHGNFISGGPSSGETAISTSCSGQISVKANLIENLAHVFNFAASSRVWVEGNDYESISGSFNAGSAPSVGRLENLNGSISFFQPQLALNGTSGAPAYSFAASPTSGWFWNSNSFLQLTMGGVPGWMTGGPNIQMPTAGLLGFSSTADPNSGALDVAWSRCAANVLCAGNGTQGNTSAEIRASQVTLGNNLKSQNLLLSIVNPTISSGFGTSPSVTNSNGTAAFVVNVGTGGTANSGVIGMPSANAGYVCNVSNRTAKAANRADNTVQTATTGTTITIQNQTTSTGAALAWTASDIVTLNCFAY